MKSLLICFLFSCSVFTLAAQSIFPDLRGQVAQDRMAKIFSKEFKTPEKVTDQIMALCKDVGMRQSVAYSQYPKNPNALSARLGQIESFFYNKIEQLVGKEQYSRYRKEQPDLLKKYNL
jgi:hypothetical protein